MTKKNTAATATKKKPAQAKHDCLSLIVDEDRIKAIVDQKIKWIRWRPSEATQSWMNEVSNRLVNFEARLPSEPKAEEWKVGDLAVVNSTRSPFEYCSVVRIQSILGRAASCTLASSKDIDAGVGVCLSDLRALAPAEVAAHLAAKAEEAKPEPWMPKVNEVMGCLNDYAYICDKIHGNGDIDVSTDTYHLGARSASIFRMATGKEINYGACVEKVARRVADHTTKLKEEEERKAWDGITELGPNDWTVRTPVIDQFLSGGDLPLKGPSVLREYGVAWIADAVMSVGEGYYPAKQIINSEWIRRAEGTIARKAKEAAEATQELQEGDWAEQTPELREALKALGLPVYGTTTLSNAHPFVNWASGKLIGNGGRKDLRIPGSAFLARAKNTAARLENERVNEWKTRTLAWPQLVTYKGREAIVRDHTRRGGPDNHGMGWVSITFKDGDTNCVSPTDLTIINPS